MSCVFCSIVEKNDPSHEIVWQDASHMAFLSADPMREGHLLVIPKQHIDYVFDMQEPEYLALMSAVKLLAPRLRETFESKRIYIGVDGFQVPHAHVHMLPVNHSGDAGTFAHDAETAEQMRGIGERLRTAFSELT